MEISSENLADYLIRYTDLFDTKQPLEIQYLSRENDSYVDGYLNYLYSVKQNGQSYIIKHSKETSSSGIDIDLGPMDADRNYLEYLTYLLRQGLADQLVPKVFFADKEQHLFIMEDLSNMEVLRFALCHGSKFPFLGREIGEFLAKCHYFTSHYHLNEQKFMELNNYFQNQTMHAIIVDFILQPPLDNWNLPDQYSQAIHTILEKILANPKVRTNWQELVTSFSEKKECLIHGDFHTSNVFIGDQGVRVIDMEYTMMGPFSYDIGYFLANLISQLAAFSCNHHISPDAREKMVDYLLVMIRDVFSTYFTFFEESQQRYAKENWKDQFLTIFHDAIGYMAIANISRTANPGGFPDFDCIQERNHWFTAKALALKISSTLLEKRTEIQSVDALIEEIKYARSLFFGDLILISN